VPSAEVSQQRFEKPCRQWKRSEQKLYLSRHCLPSLPRSCRAMSDQLFTPYRLTNSTTLSSSCAAQDTRQEHRILVSCETTTRSSAQHLFRPRAFDKPRFQHFLPPVQALYIRPANEIRRDL